MPRATAGHLWPLSTKSRASKEKKTPPTSKVYVQKQKKSKEKKGGTKSLTIQGCGRLGAADLAAVETGDGLADGTEQSGSARCRCTSS